MGARIAKLGRLRRPHSDLLGSGFTTLIVFNAGKAIAMKSECDN